MKLTMKLMGMPSTTAPTLRWLLAAQCKVSQPRSGFTLLELLVALVIGAIITTLVLGFTVDLMRNNQREASRSDTQREMQAALDYINRDLREAVYVYDGDCLRDPGIKLPPNAAPNAPACPGLLSYLPTELNAADNLPVLAFWRLDPIPDQLQDTFCRTPAALQPPTPGQSVRAAIPCTARKMYTLVVYSLNRANQGIWQGRSRITRYTLPQFTEGNGANPTAGWESPLERGFPTWPRDPVTNDAGVTGGRATLGGRNQVLVDFVDDRTADRSAATEAATCPGVNGAAAETPGGFYATPGPTAAYSATNLSRRTFYACVRGGDSASLNQEVILRIQGNAAGQPGLSLNGNSIPITMETRVLTRGVLGKT
jgi:prepilin-type N-terminal cleavage/methylation domain-containing protein